jgi:outer membrane murein-binding lipoprotein Lpp
MKSPYSIVLAVLLSVFVLAGCSKTARTDAQIATDVQNNLRADDKIASRDITVQAQNGFVTLTGTVSGDDQRTIAASDAARVEGVRTVINNLIVQQAETQSSEQEAPASSSAVANKPGREAKRPSQARNQPPAPITTASAQPQPVTPPPAPVETAAAVAPAPQPPPPPKKVTIPAGTQLTIRLNDALDTERNQVGDSFHATLGSPIVINSDTVIPSGADVVGHVVDVKSAGRFAGNSALTLELNSLSVNGKTYNIQTNQWSRQGKGEGKNTAVKAGGGAAIGAVIGGLAGGGKGAAIGSVAGAGAGTGAAATKKGEQIKLNPESTLSFLLINTLTVTEQSHDNRNAARTTLQ